MSQPRHTFKANDSLLTKCKRCGKTGLSMKEYIAANIKEAYYEPISLGNLNKFYPCISDDEVIVKDIVE